MPRGPAPTATVSSLPGPIARRSAVEQQHIVVGVARLPRLQAADDRVLPIDVDAVELRDRSSRSRAGVGERLPALLRRRHLIERARSRSTHRPT